MAPTSYLIVEQWNGAYRALKVSMTPDRRLVREDSWDAIPARNLSALSRLVRGKSHVIVAVDPHTAHTIRLPLDLRRENPKEPIAPLELENYIGQTVSRVFNQCRDEAANLLGENPLDTILAGSRVDAFKVDGHHVVTPVGFAAKRMTGVVELAFTRRGCYEDILPLIGSAKSFFFTDSVRASLVLLENMFGAPAGVAWLHPARSALFTLTPGSFPGFGRQPISWSSDGLIETVRDTWGVSAQIAKSLYHQALHEPLSPGADRALARAFESHSIALASALRSTRARGKALARPVTPLPFELTGAYGKLDLIEPPLDILLRSTGCSIDIVPWRMKPDEIFFRLAPLFEFHYNNDDVAINHWLKRRLHWLGAPTR